MTKSAAVESIETFLELPNIEGSPAWELIEGKALQKPMPEFRHSQLQLNLVVFINQNADNFYALQELRCIVSGYAPVPDIVVALLDRLPEQGPLRGAPDWLIEIRSPDQGTLDLQTKIIHCLNHGTQLAWLIDFIHGQVWVWQGDALPVVCSGSDQLPTLGNLPAITVDEVVAMTHRP
ncbi:MAG: Uma2 family endonuclease [Cyanobacteria bacterium P01_A01_bin.105]